MKSTYNDFLASNPNCSKFASNRDAQAVFQLLNQDESIIQMIEFAESGKPALAGCVAQVEAFIDRLPQPTIDLHDDFTRMAIGRMVKAVLEPFGYRPTTQKIFPKSCGAMYFRSASCYRLSAPAVMRVVKRIEEIPAR